MKMDEGFKMIKEIITEEINRLKMNTEINTKMNKYIIEDYRNLKNVIKVCDNSSLESLERELKGIKYVKHCQLMDDILVIRCKLDTIMILKHDGYNVYIDEIEGVMNCGLVDIHKHYTEEELLNVIESL